jgi:hypothetical protein
MRRQLKALVSRRKPEKALSQPGEPHFRSHPQPIPGSPPNPTQSHSLSAPQINRDVFHHESSRLRQNTSGRKLLVKSDVLFDEIVSTLVGKADGMYVL